jgi:hypothetical protein
MSKLVDDIVRERRRGGAEQAQKDLLNFMLAGVDKQTGESLSDENIRYQIITFLIAGHETTSGLMSFTLYFLVNNPEVLERAYEEVDRVLGKDIGVMPTPQQVSHLIYVQQILNESLRLYPTAPAIGLYPYKDEIIGGKYKLKKNTFVTLLTLMLHRDPSVWGPEPEKFNPENFSREAEAKPTSQRLQAMGQWPARLHRTPVRHAGSDARHGHAAAALPVFRSQEIPAQDQGIAVDQAGRFHPQGEAAPGPDAQCSRRWPAAALYPTGSRAKVANVRSMARRQRCCLAPISAQLKRSRATSQILRNSTALM